MAGFGVTFVPFLLSEWKTVADAFRRNDDAKKLFDALQAMTTWKLRFCSGIPVAVHASEVLLHARLNDIIIENDANLPLWHKDMNCGYILGVAVTRFVNFLSELGQKGTPSLMTVKKAVEEFGIPEWIVALRHEVVHSVNYPSTLMLRKGFEFCWEWMKENYWNLEPHSSTSIGAAIRSKKKPISKTAIEKTFKLYMQRRNKSAKKSGKISEQFKVGFHNRLKKLLVWDEQAVFEYMLIECDVLVLDAVRLEFWGWRLDQSSRPPPLLLEFWQPFFHSVAICHKMSSFLRKLCSVLGTLNEKNVDVRRQMLAWFRFLVEDSLSSSIGGRKWLQLLSQTFKTNVDLMLDEQVLSILIEKSSPHLSEERKCLLRQLCQIRRANFDDSNVESVLDMPLFDIPSSNSANEVDGPQSWTMADAKIDWSKCPIGLLPNQVAETLDLRLHSKSLTLVEDVDKLSKDDKAPTNEEIWII